MILVPLLGPGREFVLFAHGMTVHIEDVSKLMLTSLSGRLAGEFGRICKRRKLAPNLGKSKVTRCSMYKNGGRMHVILNS